MKDLYKELAEYTGKDLTLVEARCQIANIEQAWRWSTNREWLANPLKGYREDDLYIFDLTHYQMNLQKSNAHNWLRKIIREHGWKTGLEFGGGIGEWAIVAMEEGVDMTFCEVRGSKTLEYALWRFDKYKVVPKIVFEDYKIEKDFDFIIAMDVFEHMVDPKPVIEAAAKHTKFLFCNPYAIKFNWLYPQHISKFRLDPHFEKVEFYLWRRTDE